MGWLQQRAGLPSLNGSGAAAAVLPPPQKKLEIGPQLTHQFYATQSFSFPTSFEIR